MAPESISNKHTYRSQGTSLGRLLVFLTVALLVLALTSPALASSTYGTWTPTGSMTLGRSHHFAERLNDGQVLVASGYTDAAAGSAEIHDPVTGTWSSTGSLNFTHLQGTMTKLNDGRILIVGGQVNSTSAEIYDPARGTWSNTGSLNQGRNRHTATLLTDGRVLVVGGIQGSSLASVEIYDPAIGTWSITGSLIEDRFDHTATLLADGRVLVAGGLRSPYASLPIASAETYDPLSGVWSSANSMAGTHAGHTATLLNSGKVLIVGGCTSFDACGGSMRPDGVELYDPNAGTWASPANPLQIVPDWQTATKLGDGRVLILGVQAGTRQNWLYDPNSDSFTWAGSTTALRLESTATLLNNGQVLHAGGHPYSLLSPYASADLYTPPDIAPTPTPPPPANGLHVGDLDSNSFPVTSRYWGASVTITVVDNNDSLVIDATVSGSWSGGISGAAACTTGASGTCTVTSEDIRKNKGSVVFAVSNVSHATLVYNPEANSDPDGDSDGTAITVSRP